MSLAAIDESKSESLEADPEPALSLAFPGLFGVGIPPPCILFADGDFIKALAAPRSGLDPYLPNNYGFELIGDT